MASPRSADAIAELVKRHYERVYRYAYRLSGQATDAEDLCQETFVKAQEHLDQLRAATRAEGWLLTICRNEYLQRCRRQRRMQECSLAAVPECPEESEDEPRIEEVDPELLQAALLELPEEFRTPLILFYFEDFSYLEIAEQMAIPLGTVMSRLARGKRHLRQRLAPAGVAVAASK